MDPEVVRCPFRLALIVHQPAVNRLAYDNLIFAAAEHADRDANIRGNYWSARMARWMPEHRPKFVEFGVSTAGILPEVYDAIDMALTSGLITGTMAPGIGYIFGPGDPIDVILHSFSNYIETVNTRSWQMRDTAGSRPLDADQQWRDHYKVQIKMMRIGGRICRRLLIRSLNDPAIPWDTLQQIKNEVLGEDAVAVEVFPRRTDMINHDNTRHLWEIHPDVISFLPTFEGPPE
jgi:hypothetical protein